MMNCKRVDAFWGVLKWFIVLNCWVQFSVSAEEPLADECLLPDCFLPKSGIPGGLPKAETPQLVFFTFDDAITPTNKPFYDRLFNGIRVNPNGCPILATFYVTHNYTIYDYVTDLYSKGHEFGSHSLTHRDPSTWWETASVEEYEYEIVGEATMLNELGGVPLEEIRSMRVPFLALGGDNQFTMLDQNGFTYDTSMSSRSEPPAWPFTLHQPDKLTNDLCSIDPNDCPKLPYPLWEVALNRYYMVGSDGYNCTASMVDGCRPGPGGEPSREEAYEYLMLNFNRHYNSVDKTPYGLNMHAAWFQYSELYYEAMEDFVDTVLALGDVWIVPAYKVIEWIRTPTPLSELNTFPPFSC